MTRTLLHTFGLFLTVGAAGCLVDAVVDVNTSDTEGLGGGEGEAGCNPGTVGCPCLQGQCEPGSSCGPDGTCWPDMCEPEEPPHGCAEGLDLDCDGWFGCSDPDCLGLVPECDDCWLDRDGDGWSECDGDCDDMNSQAYPGAPVDCALAGVDFNCNGQPDELDAECGGAQCGNGVIDQMWEQCDGSNLNGFDCTHFGHTGGMLQCDGMCQLDTSACDSGSCLPDGDACAADTDCCTLSCMSFGECGCLNLQDSCIAADDCCPGSVCMTQAFPPFDSVCTVMPCGNGAIDSGEECDGMELGGADCASLGYLDGTLQCDPTCTFDTSGCSCLPGGALCQGDAYCCEGNCNSNGLCGDEGCGLLGQGCAMDPECCSQICDPASAACAVCKSAGSACLNPGECCSGNCAGGICSP